MRRPDSPCLNCEERHVGCHSECEAYKAFRGETDKYNGIIHEARAKIDIELTRVVANSDRIMRDRYNGKGGKK